MKRILPFLLLAALFVPAACEKDPSGEQTWETKYYANVFAFNTMQTYYLWAEEMSDAFSSWTYGEDPIKKVESMRYKDAYGNQVDKWTRLMEDCSSFLGSVTGNTKSFGFDFKLYYADEAHTRVCAAVTYTYAGSPAEKAGLKRGDLILTLDGQEMTPENYSSLVKEKIYGGDTVRFGLADSRRLSITSAQMYENPVHTVSTFTVEGKKFGYLHFSSFTMDACKDLENAFRTFKQEGVEELVLDLRYNTGGYTLTSTVLASMLAPLAEVKAGSVFNRDIYNQTLSDYFTDKQKVSCFAEEFDVPTSADEKVTYKVHPAQVNPDVKKLWVIVTGDSASASEALICGLKPYMDISLVGQRTYGKFCGGYLIQAEDFFDSLSGEKDLQFKPADAKAQLKGWGIYVIASRYSDKDGVTLSMPDGIPADYEAVDNPTDGKELGDPSETMLARVLALATGKATKAPVAAPALDPAPPVRPAGFGSLLYPFYN